MRIDQQLIWSRGVPAPRVWYPARCLACHVDTCGVRAMSHPARVDTCQARGCRAAAVRASAALCRQADPAHPQVCFCAHIHVEAGRACVWARPRGVCVCPGARPISSCATAPCGTERASCWRQFVRSGSLSGAATAARVVDPAQYTVVAAHQWPTRLLDRAAAVELPRGGGGGCCCGPRPGVRMI